MGRFEYTKMKLEINWPLASNLHGYFVIFVAFSEYITIVESNVLDQGPLQLSMAKHTSSADFVLIIDNFYLLLDSGYKYGTYKCKCNFEIVWYVW